MILEISTQAVLAAASIVGAVVVNGLTVLRMFYAVERRLAVIETRMRYIEKQLGVRDDTDPTML